MEEGQRREGSMKREQCEGSKQPATPAKSLSDKTAGVCSVCGGVFRVTMDGRPFPHKQQPAKLESETAKASEDLGL